MYPDDMGPPKDLTPGDWHVTEGTVDVKTDSLLNFARSYDQDARAFMINAAMPTAFMAMDADSKYGEYAIGKHDAFSEARLFANRVAVTSDQARTLVDDLGFGNQALVWVAMVMSEQYDGTDGWNAARTADAVNDAFNPKGGETLADLREQHDREREGLPVVDPSDVKLYLMSGKKPGEDFVIAGSENAPPMMTPGSNVQPDDPKTKKDESKEQNPYFDIPATEIEQLDPYVPPGPKDPGDTNAVRFDENGVMTETLGETLDKAADEPGVIRAYYDEDSGEIVRVHEASGYGGYGGQYTTRTPYPS